MNITIRPERPSDWHDAEFMTKKAFWNLHRPGCDEHLLVHKLRSDAAYLPELSRVAECDGRIAGGIYYSRARVGDTPVLTFGPLCVDPAYQNRGVGGRLLEETMRLAREAGHRAILIYGEPGYYPRHGFVTCDRFGITTPDGKNFDAFMGIELVDGGLAGVRGALYESDVFSNLPPEEVAAYDRNFPYLRKRILPGQWDLKEVPPMEITTRVLDSFSVIGKEGSTDDGEGFVQRLWNDANTHFSEVAPLALPGSWGLMSDLSRQFLPWTEHFSRGLYLAGVPVPDGALPPEGWAKWTIPAFEYVCLKVEGSYDDAFYYGLKVLEERGLPLVGAVQEYNCPSDQCLYLYYPIRHVINTNNIM